LVRAVFLASKQEGIKRMKIIRFEDMGPKFKEIRGLRTLKEFGALLSLTPSHICEIESGQKTPSLNVVAKYADRSETEIRLVFKSGKLCQK
tara:strand:+ start:604 stop:876 length:273 start_codon:yes stop_codon:yes gene_type:complete